MKNIPPKPLMNLENLGFNTKDKELFDKIIELEESLLNSSSFAHHLKSAQKATGQKVSFDETTSKETQIILSMSNIEDMVKAYVAIVEIRKEVCLPNSIIIHFGITELGRLACQSTNLTTINIAVTYLEQSLAANSKLMKLEEGSKTHDFLVFTSLLHLGALHSKVGSDIVLTTEYYKQAWLIGQKIAVEKDNIYLSTLKVNLDQFYPGFTTEKSSSCSYITTRGDVKKDDLSLIIKAAILPKILSKIPELVQEGKWTNVILGSDWGIKGYTDSKYVNKILKQGTHCTSKDIEKAQMLCFETICAATLSSKNKNGTKCLEEFIKAYPSLVARVLSIHPEYCLDGKIVSTCSDTFTKGEFEFNMPEIDFINITLGGEVTDEVTDM